MRVKTKVVGWVKALCAQEEQSAAREKWEPPHQGSTTPGPRSRSAGRHQTLPVPTCPTLELHPLLALLLHLESSSLCSFAHSHGALSFQGHLHKVRPFCTTEFRWELPPHLLSFGSKTLRFQLCGGIYHAFPFVIVRCFFVSYSHEIKILFKQPTPSCVHFSLSAVASAVQSTWKMPLNFLCETEPALLEQHSFSMNLLTTNTIKY